MRTLFGRKIPNLEELKDLTDKALKAGKTGKENSVTQEVELTEEAFRRFAADFLADQPWIDPKASCIRVTNKETGEKVYIDPQGYEYPRYVGLEI